MRRPGLNMNRREQKEGRPLNPEEEIDTIQGEIKKVIRPGGERFAGDQRDCGGASGCPVQRVIPEGALQRYLDEG